jgi:hypothetical protein
MEDLRVPENDVAEWLKKQGRKSKQKKSKLQRKRFKIQFVKVPMRWINALNRSGSFGAYRLAIAVLAEDFRIEQSSHGNDEIVLSKTVTGMPRNSRIRAIKTLVRLRLIKIGKGTGRAMRVTELL